MAVNEKHAKVVQQVIDNCHGSENLYRHQLTNNYYTDGISLVALIAKSEWLISDALVICKSLSKKNSFIVVEFQYTDRMVGTEAVIRYSDGNNNVLDIQKYRSTDFPMKSFKLFYENNTLMLPGER